MRKPHIFSLLLLLCLAGSASSQTCANSSFSTTIADSNGVPPTIFGKEEHSSGKHAVTFGTFPPGSANAIPSGRLTCTYTHSSSTTQQNCNVKCTVENAASDNLNPEAGITSQELGTLSPLLPTRHAVGIAFDPGVTSGTNTSATCVGSLGGAAVSCGIQILTAQSI